MFGISIPLRESRLPDRYRIRFEFVFVALVVIAAFVVRVWGLSHVHFWDEMAYLQNAEVICCGKTNYSELASRPPLLSLIFAGVFRLWHSIYAACIVTALINAMGSAFLYLGGRKLLGRTSAAIAALLLAFLPFFVGVFPAGFESDDTGNSLMTDSPALTLIALSFWLFVRALDVGTKLGFAAAGLGCAAAVLMRFASLPSVALLGLLLFLADRKRQAALSCGAGFFGGMIPYLCWSRICYGGFLTTFSNGWAGFLGPGESPLFYLRHFAGIFSWVAIAGLAIAFLSLAWRVFVRDRTVRAGSGTGVDESARTSAMILFLWVWAGLSFAFFSVLDHKEPRYILPAAAPILILGGLGLGKLASGRGKKRIAGTAVLLIALGCTFFPIRARFATRFVNNEVSNEMRVAEFLESSVPRSTVLYTNVDYPVFAYYTDLEIRPLPAAQPELDEALDRLPQDGVLIAYRDVRFGSPPLARLDTDPHFRRVKEFPTLVVYGYRARIGP
ncbi:MAG: glycosyltransferase family 39 protein [Terracidiphilus sp.]|jgi:4-amino-4-deoxy-L-arabinose transferase-like glycosyltransferase